MVCRGQLARFGAAALMVVSSGAGCGEEASSPAQDLPAKIVPQGDEASAAGEYEPRSVLVRFRDLAARSTSIAKLGASFEDRDGDGRYDAFTAIDPSGGMAKLDLPAELSVPAALAALRADPSVLYAEPNYYLHAASEVGAPKLVAPGAQATPNDPRFGEQWYLHNTGQTGGTADADIDAPAAWDLTTGSRNVVIGVVDTGIEYAHPELAANLWTNPGEVPGNNLDDDGNGVVDDVHGFNAITRAGNANDDQGHGTFGAGIIGAAGSNSVGIAGVAWQSSLMSLKFLSASGSGTTADAIAAINYAVARKQAGVNLRALNNAWGGPSFSQAVYDAIAATNAAGILFVAVASSSAGNHDTLPSYPASYDLPNILVLTATDHNDALASFASYGANSIDLGAPGVSMLSTTLGGYSTASGISWSAAQVSGTAALLWSVAPSLTVAQVKSTIMSTGDARASLAGRTVSGRRLNAAAAVAAVADAPQAPVAAFTFAANQLAVAFTDASTDADGVIAARSWSFGDGATSTAANPTHTYAAPGTYQVQLTVTDDDGLTATTTRQVTVTRPALALNILQVLRNRARYEILVDLAWRGASGVQVELWRNGAIVDLPDNDGAHRDVFRRYETSFTWKVCELRSPNCTNQVSVELGADTATVTVREDGIETSRVVPIVDAP